MAAKQSKIRWKTILVAVICVADAVGIYAAHRKLSAPAPASLREDAVAYGAPRQQFTFQPETRLAAAEPVETPRFVRVALPAPHAVAEPAQPSRLAKAVMPEVQLSARQPVESAPTSERKSAPRVAHAAVGERHDRAFATAFPDNAGIGVIPDLTFEQQVEIAEGKADPVAETPAMASLAPADRQATPSPIGAELPAVDSSVQDVPAVTAQ